MLSPLEVAAGFPLPDGLTVPKLAPSRLEPRDAFAQSMVAPLSRPPCVVSFSGGRDSSLILAMATDVARREGLPLPVPVTVRPAGDADAEEHGWQERVVTHLGLDDWERVAIGQELDCVGPEAQKLLLRHGILWPANVHFHLPQLERAAGGSVLTGIGGDEVFSDSGWERARMLLARNVRPTSRDVLRLGLALAPRGVKRRRFLKREEVELDWLTPGADAEIGTALAGEAAAEPLGWRRRFGWLLGLRYLDIGTRSLGMLAGDRGVAMHHPFLDRGFVAALAGLPRRRRFAGRTQALAGLFAGVLPQGLESRGSKASFDETLWGAPSRAFASSWDGSGVDPEIVDVDALRRRWQVEGVAGPHTLLQALWLERQAGQSVSSSSSSVSGTDAQERGRRSSQAGNALS
jgi:asparagine synthetase B (glutamine-hydrolysing)